MQERYSRNIPAITESECALLRSKHVAVIGCGGLGGYIVEYLCRLGLGSVTVVDGDAFDESNLNRQLLSDSGRIGERKAVCAAERIRLIDPEIKVRAFDCLFDEDNALEIISGCDAVLDALDNVPSRKILSQACNQAGVPYIFGAIGGWMAQAGISMPGDMLIEKLYPNNWQPEDKSVLSFTPALCASMQVSLCTQLLTGRPVEKGKLFCFDLLSMEFEAVPMV